MIQTTCNLVTKQHFQGFEITNKMIVSFLVYFRALFMILHSREESNVHE